MPIPPSQWVRLRHIKTQRAVPSISSKTEAENYALVAYGWLVVTLAAMIPYLWTGTFHTVTDAESAYCSR